MRRDHVAQHAEGRDHFGSFRGARVRRGERQQRR